MLIRDRVQFRFPKDRELLFPAASVFQRFVNDYNERMAAADAGQGHKYMLHYGVESEDWELLLRMGLQLKQPREILNGWDMLVDFSEQRLAMFQHSGKHVCQAYCVMAGVGDVPAIPQIRTVRPNRQQDRWGFVGSENAEVTGGPYEVSNTWPVLQRISPEQLLDLNDEVLTGVIGNAGWETYLAASYGLPVIEVLPDDRPVTWLSKWINRYYRVVSGTAMPIGAQIRAAMENLKEALQHESPTPVEF